MARTKEEKQRASNYLRTVYPELVTAQADNEPEGAGNINLMADTLRKRDDKRLALDSTIQPATPVPQSDESKNLFQTPPRMPATALGFGALNISKIAQQVLSTPASGTQATPEKLPTARETVAAMTPEEKLAASIANADPTPQGFWKRTLAGLLQGGQQVQQGDTIESAFGKLLGGAVARAFPAVDVAQQKEVAKQKAIERYQLESAQRDARLKQTKLDTELAEFRERMKSADEDRAARADVQRKLEQSRLADDKRMEAERDLETLRDSAENDVEGRKRRALSLNKRGVDVSWDYGINIPSKKTSAATSSVELKRRAEANVQRAYNWRRKAVESTAADPEVSSLKAQVEAETSPARRLLLNEQFNDLWTRKLRTNEQFSRGEYERLVADEMERLTGDEPAPAVTSKGSKGKTTKGKTYDARKLVIPKAGEKRAIK